MKFNIYTANHSKIDMIEDYIGIFSYIFESRGISYKVSNRLDCNSINLIIDEFTDTNNSMKVIDFKQKNPNSIIVVILTEFTVRKLLVKTFNFFTVNIRGASIISALNLYYRIKKNHFIFPTFSDFLVGALYSPIVIYDYILTILKCLITRKSFFSCDSRKKYGYWLKRYLGMERVISHVDGVILSHGMIADGLNGSTFKPMIIGTLYPEINIESIKKNIFKDKELFIEVTGTVTPYRLEKISNINKDILELNLEGVFSECFPIPTLSSKENIVRGAYSIHPPQTRQWEYASPTRIYRALCIDYNMPILTKKFNEHPIEDICFIYDDKEKLFQFRDYYFNIEKFLPIIESKIEKYMLITNEHNNKFLDKLSALSLSKNLESQKDIINIQDDERPSFK